MWEGTCRVGESAATSSLFKSHVGDTEYIINRRCRKARRYSNREVTFKLCVRPKSTFSTVSIILSTELERRIIKPLKRAKCILPILCEMLNISLMLYKATGPFCPLPSVQWLIKAYTTIFMHTRGKSKHIPIAWKHFDDASDQNRPFLLFIILSIRL